MKIVKTGVVIREMGERCSISQFGARSRPCVSRIELDIVEDVEVILWVLEAVEEKGDVEVFKPQREGKKLEGDQAVFVIRGKIV